MATPSLQGSKIAILATDGFEQSELLEPRHAFDAAGATTRIVSLKNGRIRAWSKADWGERVPSIPPSPRPSSTAISSPAASRTTFPPSTPPFFT